MTPQRPWFRIFPGGSGRGVAVFLLASGWLACGAAFWAGQNIKPLLVAGRPVVKIEAFVSDSAGDVQLEEFIQSVQAQPFCCEATLVSSQEARAEAAADNRVRRLLEAFGGNPFPSYARVKICPEFLANYAQAAEWLKTHPAVTSVRVPEAAIERMLAGERKIERVAWMAIAAVALLGLTMACSSQVLTAANLGRELAVLELLGAGRAAIARRIFLGLALQAILLAGAAALVVRLAILLARFSTSWWAGPAWLARIPAFSLKAAGGLFILALAVSGAVSMVFFLRRVAKKPD